MPFSFFFGFYLQFLVVFTSFPLQALEFLSFFILFPFFVGFTDLYYYVCFSGFYTGKV